MKYLFTLFCIILLFTSVYSQDHQWVQQGIFAGEVRVIYSYDGDIYAGTGNGGLYRSSDDGMNWIQVNIGYNLSHTVRAVLVTPDLLLIGCDGGLYYRPLSGGSSGLALQNLNVTSLVRNTNGEIYAGTSGGIYKSTDGINWISTGFTTSIRCMAIINSNIYAGSSSGSGGVYRSTNNGASWSLFGLSSLVRSITLHPNGNIFATTFGGVHKYSGTSWTTAGLEGLDVPDLSIDGNGNMYAATWEGVYKSTNLGSTWIHLGFQQSITWSVKAVNNFVLAGRDGDGIYKTTDSGANWFLSSSGLTAARIWTVESGYNLLLAGASGGAYISTNSGTSWKKTLDYQQGNRFWAFYINSETEIYAGGSNGIYYSSDSGSEWTQIGLQGVSVKSIKKNLLNNYLFAGTTTGVYRSTDNGVSWSLVNGGLTNTNVNDLEILPGGLILAATGGGYGVYRSTNNGTIWLSANTGLTSTYIYDLFLDVTGKLYAVASPAVFRSTNNGVSWSNYFSASLPNEYFYSVLIDPVGHKFICGNAGYYYGTPEDEWLLGIIMQPNNIQSVIEDEDGYVYMATLGRGLFKSSSSFIPVEFTSFTSRADGGVVELSWTTASETNNRGFEVERKSGSSNTWEMIGFVEGRGTSTEMNYYSYMDNLNIPGIIYYRLKQIDYDGTFSYSSETEVEITAVSGYTLLQNYPNPFNPQTTIQYIIKDPGFVSIKVFDLLGNEAAELVNEFKTPGLYSINFDAKTMASGTYLYQLKTDAGVISRKLLLIK
jgi:photosystem II stability/assembly factor-like uncharacterized protein